VTRPVLKTAETGVASLHMQSAQACATSRAKPTLATKSADASGVLKEVTMLIDHRQSEFTHCPPVGGLLRRR
jgi:hypothetical protein